MQDGEVFLALLQERGLEAALDGCAGAFAFLAYDKRGRTLYAVRDRLGVKPLCMARTNHGAISFAVSPAALIAATPDREWAECPSALASFFVLGAPFTGATAISGIDRVPPAHYVRCLPDGSAEVIRYWEPQPRPGFTMEDLVSVVREYQKPECKTALLLSGGVNSSFLATVMHGPELVHFPSPELVHAGAVARNLGRSLVSADPDLSGYVSGMERVIKAHGEPLMQCGLPFAAARAVHDRGFASAVLTTGADELFHGYSRTPTPGFEPDYLPLHEQPTYKYFNQQLGHIFRNSRYFRISELEEHTPTLEEIGSEFMTSLALPEFSPSANHRWLELVTSVAFAQAPTLDASFAAAGVEVRMPFLDHRIVEGVLSWPASKLITPQYGRKTPLREHLARVLPVSLFNRPKLGFTLESGEASMINGLASEALASSMKSGFLHLEEEERADHERDQRLLGQCWLAYGVWRGIFTSAEEWT